VNLLSLAIVAIYPVELLFKQLLLEDLLLLILLLNLTHLASVHEPVHLLEPLLVLLVHQIHQFLVLSSESEVIGRQLDSLKDADFGGLKLSVLTLSHSQAEEGLGVGGLVVDGLFAKLDSLSKLISLQMAETDVQQQDVQTVASLVLFI